MMSKQGRDRLYMTPQLSSSRRSLNISLSGAVLRHRFWERHQGLKDLLHHAFASDDKYEVNVSSRKI